MVGSILSDGPTEPAKPIEKPSPTPTVTITEQSEIEVEVVKVPQACKDAIRAADKEFANLSKFIGALDSMDIAKMEKFAAKIGTSGYNELKMTCLAADG